VARSFSAQVQHVRCVRPCQRDVDERVAIDIAQCEAVRGTFLIADLTSVNACPLPSLKNTE
jgi:hypothetical protein